MTASDRPSVTDQALAEAWAEGHRTGWEHCQDGNYGNDYWDDPTPNPYAAAGRAETTPDEECGDYPAPCNCDDPETHDGAVTAAHRPSVPRVGDTLTTAEQLDALPDKAVVLDEHVEPWQKLGEGLWCGSAGGPMSGSALLRTRTDEVTVLYVPGEQPCRHCGSCDGPPSCPDCDHAGRPSVTDNARAEAERRWPRLYGPEETLTYPREAVREHTRGGFVAGAEWAAGRAETTTAHECDSGGFDRTICDCGAMHSYCTICGTRQDDCPHGTTTTTTEDVQERAELVMAHVDEQQRNGEPATVVQLAQALADARLLATARTLPTRDDLARAIASGYEPDHPTPNRHDYRAADAVLALLRDGAR